MQYGPKRRVRRASPKMLAFFEGLFRALAETTEEQLDPGAWETVVETSQGRLALSLSLPVLLGEPDEHTVTIVETDRRRDLSTKYHWELVATDCGRIEVPAPGVTWRDSSPVI